MRVGRTVGIRMRGRKLKARKSVRIHLIPLDVSLAIYVLNDIY